MKLVACSWSCEKIRMNLALDFFGLRWCAGFTIFFRLPRHRLSIFLVIRAHEPVNDNKNEAKNLVSFVLSNRHQKWYFWCRLLTAHTKNESIFLVSFVFCNRY
jgi:hypothetical protein